MVERLSDWNYPDPTSYLDKLCDAREDEYEDYCYYRGDLAYCAIEVDYDEENKCFIADVYDENENRIGRTKCDWDLNVIHSDFHYSDLDVVMEEIKYTKEHNID